MAGYTRIWGCESCGQRQETIDWPEHALCDRCDNRTRLRCVVCGQRTNVHPQDLHRQRRRAAVHSGCVLTDPDDLAQAERKETWDSTPLV